MPTGPTNTITDVGDVRAGHVTLIADESAGSDVDVIRSGVTAVLPHGGNLFKEKVVAAVHVINAFGKAIGTTQIAELGVIETPIILTNTLSVGTAFNALVDHALRHNPEIGRTTGTVNPVVGECNDMFLNDIRGRHVREEHVLEAIRRARPGPVDEGVVGAGTGMSCYGWKGGIGTASRRIPESLGGFMLGVLVLANFGHSADLVIAGVPIGRLLTPDSWAKSTTAPQTGGSIVTIIATTAPATSRQLSRIARRAQNGLAWTGTYGEHGSGEYVFAFSTARTVPHRPHAPTIQTEELAEDGPVIDALFRAAAEATEEAVINALFTAVTVEGIAGHIRYALPTDDVLALLDKATPQSATRGYEPPD